jgi:hypothetical protein
MKQIDYLLRKKEQEKEKMLKDKEVRDKMAMDDQKRRENLTK